MKIVTMMLTLLLYSVSIYANDSLIVSTTLGKGTLGFRVQQIVLDSISKKMNKKLVLKSYPGIRASSLLSQGKIFANFARVSGYENVITNAVKVTPSIARTPIFAYTTYSGITINNWIHLNNYKVVSVRGRAINEFLTGNYDLHLVKDLKAAIYYLISRRADILISDFYSYEFTVNEYNVDTTKIKRINPPIITLDSYTYISEKYAYLVPCYSKALQELINSGFFDDIAKKIKFLTK